MEKAVREHGRRLAKAEVIDGIGMEETERRLVSRAGEIARTFGLSERRVVRKLRVWRDRYHAAYCFC